MVTQQAGVSLVGEARALDRVMATIWAEGLEPTTCVLRVQLHTLHPEGPRPLGEAWQRFGWVQVLGHGVVRSQPFPAFLQDFLAGLARPGAAPPAPLRVPTGRPLAQTRFETDSVEGNAVGNIYYTHYFRWPQRALDRFLHQQAPELLGARGQAGELLIREMRLDYLREAMPFDTVQTSVYLHPPDGSGELRFTVDYARVDADGPTRLALGELRATWSRRGEGRLEPLPLPAFFNRPEPVEAHP